MVKEKPNSTRTYDEDGFRRRAACLCVKDEHETEVLLVTSSRAPERWIVPGGGLEPNEEPSVAAMREVVEEAGVRGHLGRCLGTFENPERKHRTSVFVLVVTEELDEWEDSKSIGSNFSGRKRKWFPVEEALGLLSIHKPVQCSYLKLLTRNDKVP
ncbi:diphosphoinositol polyphosphate phosphohydrolase 1-like isoform X1 [Argiope bruennichi]|uniref:diphosphoinositol polyphosphate phosphohydrolase 1-like isoform X1 n=1 Tax=Argiope bruennichi TaxID=94029 RepID=UPI002495A57F|nr:diphosphoinositol polyphosphate phosphohydrolase 1-like isoform X1 [Argiope bruennichi]